LGRVELALEALQQIVVLDLVGTVLGVDAQLDAPENDRQVFSDWKPILAFESKLLVGGRRIGRRRIGLSPGQKPALGQAEKGRNVAPQTVDPRPAEFQNLAGVGNPRRGVGADQSENNKNNRPHNCDCNPPASKAPQENPADGPAFRSLISACCGRISLSYRPDLRE
jgi:hypothetical protein